MFAILFANSHRDQTDRDGLEPSPTNGSGLGSGESSKNIQKRPNIQKFDLYALVVLNIAGWEMVVPNIAVMENGPGLSRWFFLLKTGDIPACYVTLPEGIIWTVVIWASFFKVI